jgi:hypothetical protein
VEEPFRIIGIDDDVIGEKQLLPLFRSIEVFAQGGDGLYGLAMRRSAEEVDE